MVSAWKCNECGMVFVCDMHEGHKLGGPLHMHEVGLRGTEPGSKVAFFCTRVGVVFLPGEYESKYDVWSTGALVPKKSGGT